MVNASRPQATSTKVELEHSDDFGAYTSPQLIAMGSAVELLQRRPSGANADRGIKKPVIVARPPKKTKKK